jgi:hypothetical protein
MVQSDITARSSRPESPVQEGAVPYRIPLLAAALALSHPGASWSQPGGLQAADPDGSRIARLVRQLDSDRYAERESAARELARAGAAALPELRRAAARGAAETRRRAAGLVALAENGLDQLLADYRSFGLPLPPAGAPLVRFLVHPGNRGWSRNGDGPEETHTTPPAYGIGFLVEPARGGRPAQLLCGTETLTRTTGEVGPALDSLVLTAEQLDLVGGPPNSLAVVLQMHARGWAAAGAVLDRRFRARAGNAPRTALRLLAWGYWDRQLPDPRGDWPEASRRMAALLADDPVLDTPGNRRLLGSLTAALAPARTPAGGVEALIDGLVDVWTARVTGTGRTTATCACSTSASPQCRRCWGTWATTA